MILYQVLPRLWGSGRFSDWKAPAWNYVKSLGADAVWFTGIPRHATGKSYVKGDPGSPYSVSSWYDVNPYLADNPERRLEEFKALVSRAHRAGLKVITDFIPNHVSPECTDVPTLPYCDFDWTDTRKVDYSAPGAWDAMLRVVLFWAGLGVDGMRCDMVELVPLDFLGWLIGQVRKDYPGFIFIAEAYELSGYEPLLSAGFDYLYDKSGFYDIVRGIMDGSRNARELTTNWQHLGPNQGRMLNFLENHDEQRLASSFFAGNPQKGYAALAYGALFGPASFLIYAGQELGESAPESSDGRTSIFDSVRVSTIQDTPLPHSGNTVLKRYRAVLKLARELEGQPNWDLCYCNLSTPGFNPEKHTAFLRYGREEATVVLCNFSYSPARVSLRLPEELPFPHPYKIALEAAPWDFACKKILLHL